MNILTCCDLTKSYLKHQTSKNVVNHVSFVLHDSENILIQGLSGSGKTTLLKMCTLAIKPDHGKIYYHGERIDSLSDNEKSIYRSQIMGYVPQHFGLISMLNIYENILLPSMIARTNKNDRAHELADYLDIHKCLLQYPDELSGGQLQRAAITRAFINSPEIIIADEPTSNLDDISTDKFIQLIENHNKTGGSSIIATHDSRLLRCFHTKYSMCDGKLNSKD
jgi:ABC-type lipoprotein export system ATPase subunit